MDRLKIMVAHYTIVGERMTKLSEVCVARGALSSVKEMDDRFFRCVTEDVERLKKDPNNVNVTELDITDNIKHVSFTSVNSSHVLLNGKHVLEYYLTIVSD